MTGNAFIKCDPIRVNPASNQTRTDPSNTCLPTPCGPYSQCQVDDRGSPSCTCLPDFIGLPPQCRPQCISNSECPSNEACINQQCRDPCPNLCGLNAECRVFTHTPMCLCPNRFTGDPFTLCNPIETTVIEKRRPCQPSPCGVNTKCEESDGVGSCQCLPDYFGNPYEGCRPECIVNTDCPSNLACRNQKCIDPCPGVCGENTECQVINHLASCSCLPGYSGDPYVNCRLIRQQRKHYIHF